ncbi:methionine aminopeptidase, type I, variant 1 [Verruconis gallopava]|uniref:Methionine aminopeptidase n=2 Tax=Verruconis gallopava TaxID=253628 RepID=A0A0D2AKI9_9PEZI|nr:methionine aminopeptidase, type I, variant 1 [Verruconis gallopava]KIW07075.1 methionine aminopeptidase, type I, variant 1 [Verruconis gallopava]
MQRSVSNCPHRADKSRSTRQEHKESNMGDDSVPAQRICLGADCKNEATTLQCPTCQKQGKDSFFCSQDCFKKNWSEHKKEHKTQTGHYNPFPTFAYTGPLRPVYPLSPRRHVPAKIRHPDYARDGIPRSEQNLIGRRNIAILNEKEQEAMRKVCRLAREVLDIAAAAAKPGVTTDYIDEIVHKACIERDSYPSPLNYCHFPKSVCTSVNEVICHGIPDQYVLQDGDILNIDVTLYHGGFHGDLNETYYIGDKALADPDSVRVVECSRQCLDEAIKLVKPGMLFREPGNVIEKHAKTLDCSVIKTYCGHGINQLFHCAPNIPHYAKNKAVGTAKAGMCFTIEPMIALGTWKDKTWPDDWTSVTQDGKRTAQFEHTLLVTEDGVEVLTARKADSPGGPVPIPKAEGAAKS